MVSSESNDDDDGTDTFLVVSGKLESMRWRTASEKAARPLCAWSPLIGGCSRGYDRNAVTGWGCGGGDGGGGGGR
jgi:hypothetical protein